MTRATNTSLMSSSFLLISALSSELLAANASQMDKHLPFMALVSEKPMSMSRLRR